MLVCLIVLFTHLIIIGKCWAIAFYDRNSKEKEQQKKINFPSTAKSTAGRLFIKDREVKEHWRH